MFNAGGGADGWTDMTKLIVAFRNFAHVPENGPSRNGTGEICVLD